MKRNCEIISELLGEITTSGDDIQVIPYFDAVHISINNGKDGYLVFSKKFYNSVVDKEEK